MPLYTYECDACGSVEDVFLKMSEVQHAIDCPCGASRERVFKAPQIAVFHNYVTDNITGVATSITSRRQERALCKQHGVERVGTGDVKPQKRKEVALPKGSFKEDFNKTRRELGADSVPMAI